MSAIISTTSKPITPEEIEALVESTYTPPLERFTTRKELVIANGKVRVDFHRGWSKQANLSMAVSEYATPFFSELKNILVSVPVDLVTIIDDYMTEKATVSCGFQKIPEPAIKYSLFTPFVNKLNNEAENQIPLQAAAAVMTVIPERASEDPLFLYFQSLDSSNRVAISFQTSKTTHSESGSRPYITMEENYGTVAISVQDANKKPDPQSLTFLHVVNCPEISGQQKATKLSVEQLNKHRKEIVSALPISASHGKDQYFRTPLFPSL